MKLTVLLALMMGFSSAQALPKEEDKSPKRPFDLMKCHSAKNGTMWASFGHMIKSGEDEIRYFPTEIAVFAEGFSERIVFKDFEGDSNAQVYAEPHFVRLKVSFSQSGLTRVDMLQLKLADPRDSNSFLGNWTATVDGQESVMDLVACTIH